MIGLQIDDLFGSPKKTLFIKIYVNYANIISFARLFEKKTQEYILFAQPREMNEKLPVFLQFLKKKIIQSVRYVGVIELSKLRTRLKPIYMAMMKSRIQLLPCNYHFKKELSRFRSLPKMKVFPNNLLARILENQIYSRYQSFTSSEKQILVGKIRTKQVHKKWTVFVFLERYNILWFLQNIHQKRIGNLVYLNYFIFHSNFNFN